MWQEILNFTFDTIKVIGDFWSWATTPMLIGQDWLTPLSIVGGTGFVIIIGLWVFKLVNPFS